MAAANAAWGQRGFKSGSVERWEVRNTYGAQLTSGGAEPPSTVARGRADLAGPGRRTAGRVQHAGSTSARGDLGSSCARCTGGGQRDGGSRGGQADPASRGGRQTDHGERGGGTPTKAPAH